PARGPSPRAGSGSTNVQSQGATDSPNVATSGLEGAEGRGASVEVLAPCENITDVEAGSRPVDAGLRGPESWIDARPAPPAASALRTVEDRQQLLNGRQAPVAMPGEARGDRIAAVARRSAVEAVEEGGERCAVRTVGRPGAPGVAGGGAVWTRTGSVLLLPYQPGVQVAHGTVAVVNVPASTLGVGLRQICTELRQARR